MSLQDSTFNTSNVLDNEIIKASDFDFAFTKVIENVSKSTQMILESNQDFVINGKVLPYEGMNVKVSPIYGVCKSTGLPFGRTEEAVMEYGFAESTQGRVDIIEVQGGWETFDNQQRAFNDPDTDTQTYQYVDTKKLMRPVYKIKQGTEGSSVAPEVDTGYVKLAEVVIRANNSEIEEDDIKNITSDVAGMENTAWTTQKDITYNIGYISDVNARFRVQHNEDGTHKDNVINTDSLDIGVNAKQVNANVLPIGGNVSIPTETITTTDPILSVIVKIAGMITTLYNAYLKYGTYGFKGEIAISAIADENNALTNPIKISAAGDGTAIIKIGNNTVLSIDANGKLSTNGYQATSNNHIVTKVVTDALSAAITALDTRVTNIENTSDTTVYTNGVLSSGTNGRYNVDSTTINFASTQNITLSGTQAIDGVTPVNGDYILVKEQTDAKENGIYQYSSSSTWSRVSTYLSPNSLKAKLFVIKSGSTNAGKIFYIPKVNFTDPTNFGTDDILFLEYFGSINALGNKIAVRDSSGHVKVASATSNEDAMNKSDVASAITTAIGNLDVSSVGGSGKFIQSISETDGKISATAADTTSTYSSTGTAVVNGKAIAAALGTLDVSSVGGSGKFIQSISETDGKISATAADLTNAWVGTANQCSGNAGSATTPYIYRIQQGSSTAAKIASGVYFVLVKYSRIYLYFDNANTASNPTLNVNNTGAKPIKIGGGSSSATPQAPSTTSTAWNGIAANTLYEGYYDGTNWVLCKAEGSISAIKAYYFSSSAGYIVYANGLCIQWGLLNTSHANNNGPWSYPLQNQFTQNPIVICQRGSSTAEGMDASGRESNTWNVTKNSFYYDSNYGYTTKNQFSYIAIGY